jgi:hypothetical protein
MADPGELRVPWLAQPFQAGMTAFVVVIGAVLAELIGGTVTNRMSTAVAVPVLLAPAAIVLVFAIAQWWQVWQWQVRSPGAEPASWWHLLGIGAALVTWGIWPTRPGSLAGAGSASDACNAMGTISAPGCLQRAAQALDGHNVTWWGTLVLILAMALLVRKSRIAAWGAIPLAFAGCELATHYLQELLLYYNVS